MLINNFGIMMESYTVKQVLTVIGDVKQTVNSVIRLAEEKCELSTEKKFSIELVLNELLVNCFKHANPSNSEPVVLIATVDGGKLNASITDCGGGFRYESNDSPKTKDMLLMEYGRGLLLVRAYCDKIKYNQKGNSVEIEISL